MVKREIDEHGLTVPTLEKREQRKRNDIDDMHGEVPALGELDLAPTTMARTGQAVIMIYQPQDSVRHRQVVATKRDDDQRDERADRDDGARRCDEPLGDLLVE